jgi:hypothetical protein
MGVRVRLIVRVRVGIKVRTRLEDTSRVRIWQSTGKEQDFEVRQQQVIIRASIVMVR